MLLLLSPAKSLNYDTPVPAHLPHTLPAFSGDSATLIALLRGHSPQTLAALIEAGANLRLTDNVVQFRTRRYCDNPLVVQGPGAGPEVTAAGVFADLLRVAAGEGARL